MKNNEERVDLRVRRTHKLLWEALFELMTQSKLKYSTITINQICERAMVHRTTFYKHFEDKNELLAAGMKQYEAEVLKYPISIRVNKPMQMMEHLFNHQEFGVLIESQWKDELFLQRIGNQFHEILKQDYYEISKLEKDYPLPIDLIIQFHSSTFTTLATWWLQNGKSVSAEEMDTYFRQLIHPDIFRLGEDE
jgi:AcrR family transcriptional regulator